MLYYSLAALGAVLFSAKAIVVKLAYRYGVDAVTLLSMRMLISLPFFLAAWGWTAFKGGLVSLTQRDVVLIIIAGLLGYYAASLLDFMGLQYISAGLERLILFTYPSFVLLMTSIMKRTLPAAWQVGALSVSYAGLFVVYGHEVSIEGPHVALGAALVLASSLCYAAYLVLGASLLTRLGTIRVTAMATVVSASAILFQASLKQPWSVVLNQPSQVWLLSLVNATFCTVLPVFAVMIAIEKIGAPRVAQIGLFGPISTISMGALMLNEAFTLWHAAGTVLVLAGIAMLTLRKNKSINAN